MSFNLRARQDQEIATVMAESGECPLTRVDGLTDAPQLIRQREKLTAIAGDLILGIPRAGIRAGTFIWVLV